MEKPSESNTVARCASSGVTLLRPETSNTQPASRMAIIAMVYSDRRRKPPPQDPPDRSEFQRQAKQACRSVQTHKKNQDRQSQAAAHTHDGLQPRFATGSQSCDCQESCGEEQQEWRVQVSSPSWTSLTR